MPNQKNNSNRPTKEELDEQTRLAIEEAEKLSTEEEVPTEEQEPDIEAIEKEAGIVKDEVQAEPSAEVKEQLKKEVEEKTKKLSASARENQKIYAKNRVINKALVEADDIPEPTSEEMLSEFPDWEDMTATEKVLAKEAVVSRKWRGLVSQAKEQATKIEKWNESVGEFIGNPESLVNNPELEGKLDTFEEFATREENNSVPMNLLVSAFLHEQSKNKEEKKGQMFERGQGGSKESIRPKSDTVSLDEAMRIKNVDYQKYKELLMANKIDFEI